MWVVMQKTYATYNGVKVYGAVAKWYPTVTSELKGEGEPMGSRPSIALY